LLAQGEQLSKNTGHTELAAAAKKKSLSKEYPSHS